MDQEFEQGFALIMEADTEYQFYQALFLHYGRKHPECSIECLNDPVTFEPYYIVHGPFGKRIVRLNAVGTITQIHNSASWFSNRCLSGHPQAKNWTVFLCYDMDDYSSDVSKFYEGDWAQFRRQRGYRGYFSVGSGWDQSIHGAVSAPDLCRHPFRPKGGRPAQAPVRSPAQQTGDPQSLPQGGTLPRSD